MKRLLAAAIAAVLVLAAAGCDFGPSPTPAPTASPEPSATETAAMATPVPTPPPTPTPTLVPTPTPEDVDSAGSGSILFDIYASEAHKDINFDGTDEDIQFTAAADSSTVTINGKDYTVAQKNLAQEFAITDIDTTDKTMELVFTAAYDANLADSEKAFSWLYWWNGSKLYLMGALMDVKFAGDWRSSFNAADVIDGKGQVTCLAHSTELTDVWYMAYYKPAGSGRKLSEWRHTAVPLGDPTTLTCKTVCLVLSDHLERNSKRDNPEYLYSDYDNYWIPTLAPTTLGHVANPAPGIRIIAQPGDKLTITGTYGPTWFKVKTQDGYVGWIYCKGQKVGGYNVSMGWTADDMFDGLISAG